MEEEYKRLIEEIRDVYFIVQQERLALVSNYTARLYGYSRDELIGKPFLELVAPQERERLSEYYKMRTEGQQVPERYESVFLTKDGTSIPGEVTVWLTSFQDQPAIAGIVIDITERKHIMEKLQDSEEKYRNIVENSPDIIYTADPEGVVHSVNSAIRGILGYTPEEVIGRKFMDFIPSRAMPRVMADHNQLCSGNTVASQVISVSKDGIERCLEFRSVPFLRDNTVIKAQGIIRDITDNMRAEEKLNRMFQSMTDGVTVTDLEGFITELNVKAAEMHGFESKEQLLGRNVFELIAPSDRRRAVADMEKTMEVGLLGNIEYILLRKDGSEFYAELSASVLRDAFGKPEGYIAILRDITERRQAEIALQESEELFSKVFYHNPTAMAISTLPEGRILYANDSFLRLAGYSPAEVIGHTSVDIKIFKELAERNRIIQELLGDMGNTGREMLIQTKTGKLLTVLSFAKKVSINKQPHLISMAVDITERKQAEEKHRQLLEDMNDGYSVILDGKYVFVNKRFGEIFGYDPEQVLGTPVGRFVTPEDRQSKLDEYERVVHNSQLLADLYEDEAVRSDGKKITVESTIKAVQYDDKPALSVIIRDVTERRAAEKALRESSEMLRLMFECAPYGVTIMDLNAVIIDANDQALKLCGCNSKSEILGRSGLDFLSRQQRRKAMKDIDLCLREGIIVGFEYTIQKDDKSKISVQTSAGVLRGIDDKPMGLISITRDITEERQLRENKQFYISEIIMAQENERKSLARALHDDTVQELLLASHRLQDAIAGNQGRLPQRARRHLSELRILIESIMAEVRAFSVDLRPGVLDDMGLIPALRWLAKRLSEGEGIESGLKVQGKERRLLSETELSLFRIAQESLNNVRKHACASNARVILQFDENKVILSIIDNGRGFELPPLVSQFTREHKLGLTGIAERVSLLGGKYKFESSPGKGTSVMVEIDG